MFQRLPTDLLNIMLIVGVILLVIESTFFHGGFIFSAFFSGVLMVAGWKKYDRLWAKGLFWIGAISLTMTLLQMMAVRFFLLAGSLFLLIRYYRSTKEPQRIIPSFSPEGKPVDQEALIKIEPWLGNRWFGDQKTSESVYTWRDINIQGGYGHRIIDLNNTVLPEEAVISIRHGIGNIQIYIPYEVEVSIVHSSLMGRANILGHEHGRLFNQCLMYQTENYQTNKPRVKIITSILSGDLEVKRV